MYNDVIMWAEAYLVMSKSALLVFIKATSLPYATKQKEQLYN